MSIPVPELDSPGILERARTAVTDRADLPGMSLMEHLEELRRRLIHSVLYIIGGAGIAYYFRETIVGYMQKPIIAVLASQHMDTRLIYLNPIEPFNFYMKIALFGGCILASPFVLYQVWLFISPGLYKHEKRYVVPFMVATVGLFLAGAYFGYHFVYPGALNFLIGKFNTQFRPMITISEYTQLFLTVILGLATVFEMPILVFFLALFGIVNARFLWKNLRVAILIIFIISAIITPTPDPLSMCIFAAPMLVLYGISIGVAWFVHPSRRKAKAQAAA